MPTDIKFFFEMVAVRNLRFVVRLLGTTHEEYLVVYIAVQNLAEIGRAVMKI